MFIKFHFSFKNSRNMIILNSLTEESKNISNRSLTIKYKYLENKLFSKYFFIKKNREQANCVFKDMLNLICMWRQIRGYPQGGSTTHTNAKTCKKNKILYSYRLNQFYKLFGKKKRNIYPTLIKAEYNNRLWYHVWRVEWSQASSFVLRMLNNNKSYTLFNPTLLAANQTNGYTRINKALKIGKSKKLTKVFTVGVPLFFTRYMYYNIIPKKFPIRLTLKDDINKSLGKKLRRKNK